MCVCVCVFTHTHTHTQTHIKQIHTTIHKTYKQQRPTVSLISQALEYTSPPAFLVETKITSLLCQSLRGLSKVKAKSTFSVHQSERATDRKTFEELGRDLTCSRVPVLRAPPQSRKETF